MDHLAIDRVGLKVEGEYLLGDTGDHVAEQGEQLHEVRVYLVGFEEVEVEDVQPFLEEVVGFLAQDEAHQVVDLWRNAGVELLGKVGMQDGPD